MRLIALENIGHPLNKKKGETFELADGYARTYIMLGKAERAKREYKRRDMRAEDTHTVILTGDK